MDPIKVMVRVWYLGTMREEIVEVPEDAFRKHCWRPIASLMAAVKMELPFTEVERLARYGLRPEDKQRLLAAGEAQKERAVEDAGPSEGGQA